LLEIKYKHEVLWVSGRDIQPYTEHHPAALTFGVYRWTPIEKEDDIYNLPLESVEAFKVLFLNYQK